LAEVPSEHSQANNFARLLIITHEIISERMAGPGIRAWELARALGQQGVQVSIASPFEITRSALNVQNIQFSWEDPTSLAEPLEQHDVVLAAGPLLSRLYRFLDRAIEKPTIVDIYDVAEIERILLQMSKRQDSDGSTIILYDMLSYLRLGDLYICASKRQYDLWMGALLAAGRINSQTLHSDPTLESLLKIVPFGIPDDPIETHQPVLKGVKENISPNDKIIFWSGGIWDWTDPITLLEAFKQVLSVRQDVRLVFGALHHFHEEVVPEMSVARKVMLYLEKEDWIDRYVFFLNWVPYDERGIFLKEADLGVSLFNPSIENRYAVRSRLFDCLWAKLPCIVSEGDYMAEMLRDLGLGLMVPPGDLNATTQALLTGLDKSDSLRSSAVQLPEINQMGWASSILPILDFLRSPHHAPDAETARGLAKVDMQSIQQELLIKRLLAERNNIWLPERSRLLSELEMNKRIVEKFRSHLIYRLRARLLQLVGRGTPTQES
jgi:glycosyltransferase involved in cell wall biosynthesis